MAELAWQGFPKNGTRGGDGRPHEVGWDGDPERAMQTLGSSLSTLALGVTPNLREGRRLNLGCKKFPGAPKH